MIHAAGVRRGRILLIAAAAAALVAVFAAVPAWAAPPQAGAATGAATHAAKTGRWSATIKDAQAAARDLLEQSGAASISVAFVSGDKVVWSQGFGYADMATQTAPGPDTMYGIGSVSKMLATVAVMKLADQGLVDLDVPLAHYVPSFTTLSPAWRQITVRMLMNHSSGLPGSNYPNLFTAAYWPGYLQETLDTIAAEGLKTTPGYMNVYCNDGFTLLEALIPAVTGKSYEQYVTDEVLTPLGMLHTKYPVTQFPDGSYAKCYTDGVAHPQEVTNSLASGGAYSTPTDLSVLARMLANGGVFRGTRILSPEAVAEMATDQTAKGYNPQPSDFVRYGIGWDTVTEPGLKAVGFTGWTKGGDCIDFHAGMTVVAQQKLSVAVTTVAPLDSGACEGLAQRILLHALVAKGNLRRVPAPIPASAPPVKTASAAQLAAMEGVWAKHDMVMRFSADPARPQSLMASVLTSGGWTLPASGMRLRTDGRFHAPKSPNSFTTITAGDRRYLVYRYVAGNGFYRNVLLFAQKLKPQAELSAAWRARVGHTWVAANGQPDSTLYTATAGPLLAIGEIPGLAGWATVNVPASYGLQPVDPKGNDGVGSMFLQIPGEGSRDLEDAVFEPHGAEEWVWWSAAVYRPLDTVAAPVAGANTVTFDADAHTEWRSVTAAATLQIAGGTAWVLYDGDFNVLGKGTTSPAETHAPAGSYLALFGPAGSSTALTVTPAASATTVRRAIPTAPDFRPPLQ